MPIIIKIFVIIFTLSLSMMFICVLGGLTVRYDKIQKILIAIISILGILTFISLISLIIGIWNFF